MLLLRSLLLSFFFFFLNGVLLARATGKNNNLTTVMSSKGCGLFASLLSSTADAIQTYTDNLQSGITVFCPTDAAIKAFSPKLKNLSGDAVTSLLLYHAIPVYDSLDMLRQGNGAANTLATDGATRDYNLTIQNDGETVTIRTAAAEPARITATVFDADPVAVFSINSVLQPLDLFPPPPAPAPAPTPAADSPAPPAADEESSPPAPAGERGKKSSPAKDGTPPSGAGLLIADVRVAVGFAGLVLLLQ